VSHDRHPGDAARTADDLAGLVIEQLEALAERHAPDLTLPRVFAGHPVGPDAHADLAYTLMWARRLGPTTIGGRPIVDALHHLLATVDGPGTNTFFSYRIAEVVADLGGIDAVDLPARPGVLEAVDSTEWIELLDGGALPRNYAIVLARCEHARLALGIVDDRAVLDDLLERIRRLLGEHPAGWLDDSNTGRGQVDMYTVDAYLFAEPLADELGAVWSTGIGSALDLVGAASSPDGASLAWGRSIGALALCHTAELAALALRRDLVGDRARWLGVAAAAGGNAPRWFSGGLITSHQHRATFRYRGPFRRLQMTLDCLGKLAAAAVELRQAQRVDDPPRASRAEAFPPVDRWIAFDDRGAGVWAHRAGAVGFTLPVVGGVVSDYAPAPRRPGLFEVPVDRPMLAWVPVVHRGTTRFGPGGRAAAVDHAPGRLSLTYDRFRATVLRGEEADPAELGARRTVTYEVQGRTLTCTEDLELDEVPDALAVTIPEAVRRPLVVSFETGHPHRVDRIDTSGVAEWRSVYGELPTVHQLDLEPARRVRFRWSVTPVIRVLSTAWSHHYDRTLYEPLAGRVTERLMPLHLLDDPVALRARLADADVVHLHWPEWLAGPDPDRARRIADVIRGAGVRLLWTQHNLAPHDDPTDDRAYRVWAEAADAVHHHSQWGEREVQARWRFRADALHRVIPHPHFGAVMGDLESIDRDEAEALLGLAPCRIRLGIVGAPRPGKDTQLVIDAVHASARDDIALLVLSGNGESVPDDPRITVLPYAEVPRAAYDQRLRCLDALVLPLEGASYLTTGQPADAVAAGLPCLTSGWPYLEEVLGDAAIPYGATAADLTATLDRLDEQVLHRAGAAAASRRAALAPAVVAEALFGLLDELCQRG
jgi:glycosyltransferase involved in cell wall biosynthesis